MMGGMSESSYRPSREILNKYAQILINFALWSGEGIRKGDVVVVSIPEAAKPLLWELQEVILKAGGHMIARFSPDGEDRRTMGGRMFFELANEDQLDWFPEKYMKGLIEEADHWVSIIADDDPHALKGIDSAKIMRKQLAMKPAMDWRTDKEHQGKLTWTLALYGTESMAKEADMSLEEYWNEIITACYLDEADPVAKWKEIAAETGRVKDALDAMPIDKLHVEAEDTDLWITLGEKRLWKGGEGRNIPSFEVFTSPDCRYTEGHIRFSEPLYLYGQKASGIKLWFEKGRVVKLEAEEGKEVLEEMIKVENADRVGEFSLTDGRMSKITKFMANTLFDENVGGPQGNTHLALGRSYEDVLDGDVSALTKEESEALGFNDSVVHTDIMSTTKRTVTAVMKDGTEQVIYDDGKFLV